MRSSPGSRRSTTSWRSARGSADDTGSPEVAKEAASAESKAADAKATAEEAKRTAGEARDEAKRAARHPD